MYQNKKSLPTTTHLLQRRWNGQVQNYLKEEKIYRPNTLDFPFQGSTCYCDNGWVGLRGKTQLKELKFPSATHLCILITFFPAPHHLSHSALLVAWKLDVVREQKLTVEDIHVAVQLYTVHRNKCTWLVTLLASDNDANSWTRDFRKKALGCHISMLCIIY
jgi:hypothetical protein